MALPQTNNIDSRPSPILMGVALLGWMEREQAIRFLTEDCWFENPLTETGAELFWQRVARSSREPARTGSPGSGTNPAQRVEREHAERFLEFLNGLGVRNVQVIKMDPMQLVVAQYHIAIDVAAAYAELPAGG